jgi:hypothetical protein
MTTKETPDQMLERLELMGLKRVKGLITLGHFEKVAIPLVKGWIERKEQELLPSTPDPEETDQKLRMAVEQASRQAQQAEASAKAAQEAAIKAKRTASIAITIAVIGAVISILFLFALAIR